MYRLEYKTVGIDQSMIFSALVVAYLTAIFHVFLGHTLFCAFQTKCNWQQNLSSLYSFMICNITWFSDDNLKCNVVCLVPLFAVKQVCSEGLGRFYL